MRDLEGYGRTQPLLLPDLLDDDVTEEPPVRVLDASVARLDLARLGCARAHAALTGRPGDDPRDLLTLSLYGYLHRRRSRRRRERATHRNGERIWLLRHLRPDVKTMAEFRQQHTTALPALFRACVLLCQPWELLGAALLASDGRQFKAVKSQHQHVTQATREQALQDIDAQGAQSVRALDASESEESSVHPPTRAERQEKIERRKERQQRYRGCVQAITASGETQRSLTAPESRSMAKSPKVDGGDHVQLAVDRQPTLMVAPDVTQAITDADQLSPLAIHANETWGVDRMSAGADLGDSHGHAINAGAEAGMAADVSKPATSAHTTRGRLGKERFTSAPEQDGSRCPRGEELTCRCDTIPPHVAAISATLPPVQAGEVL